MRIIERLDDIVPEEFAGGTCVAIGKFDGLHRGHQAILRRMREAAAAEGLTSVVVTFSNHPLSYLDPERVPFPLMSGEQRMEAFAAAGVDVCVCVRFDAELASIPADDFIAEILVGRLGARHIMLGADFRFGHLGTGDAALLERRAPELGYTTTVLGWVEDGIDGQVSSSKVRAAITSGDVAHAASMLGRPPAVRGEVVYGDARGRELGFPTANLGGRIEGLVPADGVYAGEVVIDGERYTAAISVGNNPTFTPDEQSRVEAFILDFDRDVYGRRIEVRFAERLRGMVRFDSLDALIEQMHADVARTRRVAGSE